MLSLVEQKVNPVFFFTYSLCIVPTLTRVSFEEERGAVDSLRIWHVPRPSATTSM